MTGSEPPGRQLGGGQDPGATRGRGPSRTRPPRAVVRAAVRAGLLDLEPGARVLVALSGGPDSLALCSATARVGPDLGLLVAAAVVDHQLQAGSAEVAERAAQQARWLGCDPVLVLPVVVPDQAGGPEAAARRARYRALATAAADLGTAAILLGHTREDQAETVLIRLARGAGTRSLAAMAPLTGLLRRPLLDLPREVVAAAAAADAADDPRLTAWADPHNTDPAFLRVRVRTELLPLLADILGPAAVLGLARTAEQARMDADELEAQAARLAVQLGLNSGDAGDPGEPGQPALPALPAQLATHPAALRTRVIRSVLTQVISETSWDHVRAVDRLLADPPGQRATVRLPGGWLAGRTPTGSVELTRG